MPYACLQKPPAYSLACAQYFVCCIIVLTRTVHQRAFGNSRCPGRLGSESTQHPRCCCCKPLLPEEAPQADCEVSMGAGKPVHQCKGRAATGVEVPTETGSNCKAISHTAACRRSWAPPSNCCTGSWWRWGHSCADQADKTAFEGMLLFCFLHYGSQHSLLLQIKDLYHALDTPQCFGNIAILHFCDRTLQWKPPVCLSVCMCVTISSHPL